MSVRESDFINDKHDWSTPGADFPASHWTIPPLPRAKQPGRIGAALAWLLSVVPLPTMPRLLAIPFVAGVLVFWWLVVGSGWGLYIGP